MTARARILRLAAAAAPAFLAPALVLGPVRDAAAQTPPGKAPTGQAPTGRAPAAPGADAGAHFERGVSFFKDGDHEAAMVEFKKAYEIAPNYRVLYNLGQTSRELRDYAVALTTFELYLAEGGAEIEAERRASVEGWIADLRGKVGSLAIATNVEGADVAIDDIAVGKTPLAKPIRVNAGRRKLTMSKVGHAPLTRFVDVAGTEQKALQIDLVPLTAAQAPPVTAPTPVTPPPTSIEESDGPSAWPWAALGITAATGAATAIVGAIALSKKSDFDDALETYPTSAAAVDDARSDARAFATTADVLGGVTIAGAIVTVLGFVIEGQKGGDDEAARRPVRVVASPGFTGLDGSF